jgi:hypothetical protein
MLTILCAGGFYIHEQKQTIAEQEYTIQELTASQRPPIVPEKRKVKVMKEKIDLNVVCKPIIDKFEAIKEQCTQCAYTLQVCQNTNEAWQRMKQGNTDGTGEQN